MSNPVSLDIAAACCDYVSVFRICPMSSVAPITRPLARSDVTAASARPGSAESVLCARRALCTLHRALSVSYTNSRHGLPFTLHRDRCSSGYQHRRGGTGSRSGVLNIGRISDFSLSAKAIVYDLRGLLHCHRT